MEPPGQTWPNGSLQLETTQFRLSIFFRCLGCEVTAVAAGFRLLKKWGSSLSSHLENIFFCCLQ